MSDVSSRIVCAMRDFASRRVGRDVSREVFETACLQSQTELGDAVDPRGWVSLDTFHTLAEAYTPLIGDDFIADAVSWVIPDQRQLSASSLTAVASPGLFYRHLDRARSFYARHVHFEVAVKDNPRGADVELFYRDGLERRRESCAVARGVLAAVPRLFDLPAASVVELDCYARGAETCRYEVAWRRRRNWGVWGFGAGAAVAGLAIALGAPLWALAAPAFTSVLAVAISGRSERRYLASVIEEQRQSLGEAERDFQRRFGEITALKAALEQLEKIQSDVVDAGLAALVGELVGELAHEMRNPMSYVLNNLTVLESRAERPEPAVEHIDELSDVVGDIRHGVEEMRGVLTWFVDNFKATHGELHELHLDTELADSKRLLEPELDEHVEVHLDLGDVPPVRSYGRELVQVLVNLLVNASHAPGAENIWASTRLDGEGAVCLTIRDDGDGMDPDTLSRVFERGFTTKAQGSGLGLYICRRILERNSGSIVIESEPGDGTTVRVRLPVIGADKTGLAATINR